MSSLFLLLLFCVFHMDFTDSINPAGYLQGSGSRNDQTKLRGYYLQANICPHRSFHLQLVSSRMRFWGASWILMSSVLEPPPRIPRSQDAALGAGRFQSGLPSFIFSCVLTMGQTLDVSSWISPELGSLRTMVGARDWKVSLKQYFGSEHTQNKPAVDGRERWVLITRSIGKHKAVFTQASVGIGGSYWRTGNRSGSLEQLIKSLNS